MSTNTSIEWTDRTWNPVRGCALVSDGCRNCYAMKQAHRFAGPGKPYDGLTRLGKHGPTWTGQARFIASALEEPLGWRKPQRVFVNSMSDLFHEDLTNEQIAAVFGVMASAGQHTFQVLTKRAKRMRDWFQWVESHGVPPDHVVSTCAANYCDIDQLQWPWPLPNVWLGVSVEDQKALDERVPHLLATPAAVRFLSCEPLLGDVDLSEYLPVGYVSSEGGQLAHGSHVDWVIVGGESGPGSRPMCLSWAMNVVHDCVEAKVPCFVKQLGRHPYEATDAAPLADGSWPIASEMRLHDRKGGTMSEWPEYLQVREFPGNSQASTNTAASATRASIRR